MFTEAWLQALTLAVSTPAARQVKPLINDLDSLSQAREAAEQTAASQRVWDFASQNHLLPLLKLLPIDSPQWQFDDEETFSFEPTAAKRIESLEDWRSALGITGCEVDLKASAVTSEWAGVLRREAVRHGKSISTALLPNTQSVQLNCTAAWDRQQWAVRIKEAEWRQFKYPQPFRGERESLDVASAALSRWFTDAKVAGPIEKVSSSASPSPWIRSVPRLEPLHAAVFAAKPLPAYANTLQAAWQAVWPVIYREQNRLNQPVDLNQVRQDLAASFRDAPQLTLSIFVAAKLICLHQLGRGLGVCGDWQ